VTTLLKGRGTFPADHRAKLEELLRALHHSAPAVTSHPLLFSAVTDRTPPCSSKPTMSYSSVPAWSSSQ